MVNTETALALVKTRLNRLQTDTSLDEYLTARINGAIDQLDGIGIHLTDSTGDLMLLVDYTEWAYKNRDKPGAMPDWLRLERRERWIKEGLK